jgi:hypothetical protein
MSQFKSLFLGFFALIGLMVLALLVYEFNSRPNSPCESIFEQTTRQFDWKLKTVATEGSVVLGRQQVQALSDNAQKTALNLKTCCIVLDSGAVNPDQFLQCQNAGRDYQSKLDDVVRQIVNARNAQQSGDQDELEALRRSLAATIDEARAISGRLQESVGEIGPPPDTNKSDATENPPTGLEEPKDETPIVIEETLNIESESDDGTPEVEIEYSTSLTDLGAAINITSSVLPTLIVSPITRFIEPGISEVLVVTAGTNLSSFRPVQRSKQFDVPMIVEPGVYDLIIDTKEQSMIRLIEGFEVQTSQQVTVDPNPFISFVMVKPLQLEGFPQLGRIFALTAGTSTSGSFQIKHRTKQSGIPLIVEPGTYDVYVEPVGGRYVMLSAGLEIGIGQGVAVDTSDKVAAIVYEDPKLQGFELESIYLVTAGTDIGKRHSVVQDAKEFGRPLLVSADGSYDVVVKPAGGSAVKVQQGVSPGPGEILRFGEGSD